MKFTNEEAFICRIGNGNFLDGVNRIVLFKCFFRTFTNEVEGEGTKRQEQVFIPKQGIDDC